MSLERDCRLTSLCNTCEKADIRRSRFSYRCGRTKQNGKTDLRFPHQHLSDFLDNIIPLINWVKSIRFTYCKKGEHILVNKSQKHAKNNFSPNLDTRDLKRIIITALIQNLLFGLFDLSSDFFILYFLANDERLSNSNFLSYPFWCKHIAIC